VLDEKLMMENNIIKEAYNFTRMGEKRNARNILVGKPEGNRPLGRSRSMLENNIKILMK
jgi:hypothetical protein